MRKLILILIIVIMMSSISFADFGLVSVELDNTYDSSSIIKSLLDRLENVETKVITRTRTVTDDSKIEELKKNNRLLFDKISRLELKIKELNKELRSVEREPNKIQTKTKTEQNDTLLELPLSESLTKEQKSNIFYIEPPRSLNSIESYKIYCSRVSKRALDLMYNPQEKYDVYVGDLNIKLKDLYHYSQNKIAYNEYINIRINYSDKGILNNLIITRK